MAGRQRRGREAPRAPGRVVKSGLGCCNPLSGGNRVRGGEWPGLGAGGSRSSRGSVAGRGGKSVTGGSCRTSERAEHVFPSGSWPPPPWVGAGWEECFVPLACPAGTEVEAGRDPGRARGLERRRAPRGSEFAADGGGGSECQ